MILKTNFKKIELSNAKVYNNHFQNLIKKNT